MAEIARFSPIGVIRSPYREKFGIPRQPGLVTVARATLSLLPAYAQPEAVRGLEGFSHVWLLFVFHATQQQGWQPTVRPPRLGGNAKVGVFASRSTFRPNPLGLSVGELLEIRTTGGQVELELGGLDLLNGTPVLDIKPYLPYADALPHARAGFAPTPPSILPVRFTPLAAQQCAAWQATLGVEVRLLVEQVLAQDPRPAYQQGEVSARVYGMRLYDFDVRWHYTTAGIEVLELVKA